MPLNKVGLTINSRMYTVVSDESIEYMEMLGEHINEKVAAVLKDGRHIMGEKPIVLAALNICDEYYKLLEEKSSIDISEMGRIKDENAVLSTENEKKSEENEQLKAELERIKAEGIAAAETEAIARSVSLQSELNDAHTQIKFLESRIKELEGKNEKMKQDYERREQEIFDMIDDAAKKPANRAERRAANKRKKQTKTK
ncbi:MAG: cell division protein ZapA [bacterium]|nr:cell division protein ZapA [bacterium]